VYVTEQVAVPLEPAVRVQLVEGVKVPVLFVAKLTEPEGLVAPDEVSVTVAVQVVNPVTGSVLGEQVTPVVVVRSAIATLSALAVPTCAESPP
jgi:hypothetical protein